MIKLNNDKQENEKSNYSKEIWNNKDFIKKYSKIIFASVVGLSMLYILIYFAFKGDGWVRAGKDLHKNDWLSFLGSYLSFVGTILVSGFALLQTHYYTTLNKQEQNEYKKELYKKRLNEIQPIFSIKISSINSSIPGVGEAFNLYDSSTYPKHKNFTREIENVSSYPIKHVIIFDNYRVQLLKSNETHTLQVAYDDSPDYNKKNILNILQSEYERTNNGLAKWFNINYEDVDGNEMFQTFELREFDGTYYYSLEKIEQI